MPGLGLVFLKVIGLHLAGRLQQPINAYLRQLLPPPRAPPPAPGAEVAFAALGGLRAAFFPLLSILSPTTAPSIGWTSRLRRRVNAVFYPTVDPDDVPVIPGPRYLPGYVTEAERQVYVPVAGL